MAKTPKIATRMIFKVCACQIVMLYFISLSLFLRAGVDINYIYCMPKERYVVFCIYFESTFSRSTFGLYVVVLGVATLFPTQRGGTLWLQWVNHVDTFEYFSSMLSAKVCLPASVKLGSMSVTEPPCVQCSYWSRCIQSSLCVFSLNYQQSERMPHLPRLWRWILDHSHFAVIRLVLRAVWSGTAQRACIGLSLG